MGIKASIALGIAGGIIYPPCYAICCYGVLYSCYATMVLALGALIRYSTFRAKCYAVGAIFYIMILGTFVY